LNWLSRAWSTLERSEQLGTEKFWLLLGNSLAMFWLVWLVGIGHFFLFAHDILIPCEFSSLQSFCDELLLLGACTSTVAICSLCKLTDRTLLLNFINILEKGNLEVTDQM
jgi:hypothetical protein